MRRAVNHCIIKAKAILQVLARSCWNKKSQVGPDWKAQSRQVLRLKGLFWCFWWHSFAAILSWELEVGISAGCSCTRKKITWTCFISLPHPENWFVMINISSCAEVLSSLWNNSPSAELWSYFPLCWKRDLAITWLCAGGQMDHQSLNTPRSKSSVEGSREGSCPHAEGRRGACVLWGKNILGAEGGRRVGVEKGWGTAGCADEMPWKNSCTPGLIHEGLGKERELGVKCGWTSLKALPVSPAEGKAPEFRQQRQSG